MSTIYHDVVAHATRRVCEVKKILKGSGALVAMLLLGLASQARAYNYYETPLFAGQHTNIGKFTVEQIKEGTRKYLVVTFDVTGSGWTRQTTHLYVKKTKPTSSAPGRFPYKHEGLPAGTTVDTYKIPLSQLLCSNPYLYIAGHADTCEEAMCTPDFAALTSNMPATLTDMTVADNLVTAGFTVNSSVLGTVPAWCVDELAEILTTVVYGTAFVPSYLPDGTVNPVAAGLLGPQASALAGSPINYLNYLINQSYVKDCGNGGPYSAVDIQSAIWHLTNGSPIDAFVAYGADVNNVTAVLNDVVANGASFVPKCGDLVMVIADPQTPLPVYSSYDHNQHMAFAVQMPTTTTTGDCETAWAKGTTSFCTGWGSYFRYTVK
jgi:hypothetical protein